MDPSKLDPSMLDQVPSMEPPPGVTPNFVDPYSLAPTGRIVIGVTLPLMIINVAARLYTRIWVTRAIGADDYLCAASAVGVIAYCSVVLSMFGPGLGPHSWNIPLSLITPYSITGSVVVFQMYTISAMFIKTSLFILYRRIFRPDWKANIAIWGGFGFIVLFYCTCIVINAVFCRPDQWPLTFDPITFFQLQQTSNCNKPQLRLSAGQGIVSTVTDLYVLLIPVALIMRLQLPTQRKLGICAIFSIGIIATGCSVATIWSRFKQRTSADFGWDSSLNEILGAVELNMGIICSCLPVDFVLFKSAATTSWASIRHVLHSYTLRRSNSRTDDKTDLKAPNSAEGPKPLPKVPRATITGLRTFIRGGPGASSDQTELSAYDSLHSVDEEYHGHLRQARASESVGNPSHKSERSFDQSVTTASSTADQEKIGSAY